MDPKFKLLYDKHPFVLKEMLKKNLSTRHFTDVTLMGEDQIQFPCHRYILGIQSSVLKDLFLANPEKSSLIYLEGWRSSEIQCLLDLVYLGESSLKVDNVEYFIQNAKSLNIKNFGNDFQESLSNKIHKTNEHSNSDDSERKVFMVEPIDTDTYLDTRIRDYEASNAKLLDSKIAMEWRYVCQDCGYRSTCRANLKIHIDSVHKKIKHPCPKCEKSFAQRASLYLHKKNIHEGIRYLCDFCDHKAGTKGNLRLHTSKVHGITMTIT